MVDTNHINRSLFTLGSLVVFLDKDFELHIETTSGDIIEKDAIINYFDYYVSKIDDFPYGLTESDKNIKIVISESREDAINFIITNP